MHNLTVNHILVAVGVTDVGSAKSGVEQPACQQTSSMMSLGADSSTPRCERR